VEHFGDQAGPDQGGVAGRNLPISLEPKSLTEATALLDWLPDDNFVFLGTREFTYSAGQNGGTLRRSDKQGLGNSRGSQYRGDAQRSGRRSVDHPGGPRRSPQTERADRERPTPNHWFIVRPISISSPSRCLTQQAIILESCVSSVCSLRRPTRSVMTIFVIFRFKAQEVIEKIRLQSNRPFGQVAHQRVGELSA
jgi:hypothetical protein